MDLTEFLDRVKFVPNCFNLNIVFISSSKLRTTLEKMDDSDSSTENKMFDMMHHNLSSFIYFLFSEFSQSETAVQWVLDRHPRNIQANTTKSVLCFNQGSFAEAEELIENLHRLSEDEYLMAEAEAEMAHAYSRLGSQYYNLTIKIFNKVTTSHPQVYEWKYRLALTIRRCQHPQVRKGMPSHDVNAGFAKCKQLFEDVIDHCTDNDLKALSFVEMAALFIFPNSKGVDFRRQGIYQDIDKVIIDYLDKAMELTKENDHVLTEAGRILRSLKKFSAAKHILESAVQLKPGTKNCHHLALVLQKLGGSTDLAIAYLEQSVELSKNLNFPAIICLTKAYLEQSPPDVTRALECCRTLIDTKTTHWVAQGSEQASKCCTMMANQHGISRNEKTRLNGDADRFNKIHIISTCLLFLKTSGLEKINSRELFAENLGGRRPYYDFNSPRDQIKRVIRMHKGSTALLRDFQNASSSIDITRDLVQIYLQRKQYNDCLDLVTMLLITELPGIKKLAIDTMMQIVPLAVLENDLHLVEDCFKRPLDIYYDVVDDVDSYIRIISDINTSGEEVNMIRSWLEEIGLKVTHNDEDILPYMNKSDALISAMSSNIVVICIFKDNKCHILDGYPIQLLQADKPVILPMVVNGSQVSPIVENYNSIPFPSLTSDANERGRWLKAIGLILFQNI